MEDEAKISSRTPNPETKLWDLQQSLSGLVVLYMPHTQEIPSPERLSLVSEKSSFTQHFLHMVCNIATEAITSLTRYSLLKNRFLKKIYTNLYYLVPDSEG